MRKIIAEIGSTHDGSFGNAKKIIKAAAECGADIIKFQLHIPDSEMLPNAPSPSYFKTEGRYEYFLRTNFNLGQFKLLKNYTEKLGMNFMVSPFSEDAVDFLNKINIKFYKVASGEVTNISLLEKLKKTKKNIFLSTGMSNWNEIDQAIKILPKNKTVIMQCTSIYPCPETQVGLNNIAIMMKKYKIPVGFSDHYLGVEAGFAAAALGATHIEKHITFSRQMYGSDAPYAMELDEFRNYVKGIKNIWKMLDSPVNKNNLKPFSKMKKVFEKSIVVKKTLKKGHLIKKEDLSFKKPGDGIPANSYKKILGKTIKKNLPSNYKLKKTDIC